MTNESTPSTPLHPPVGGFQEIDGRRLDVHRQDTGGTAAGPGTRR
ncbi:hypothetical protein ACIRRH_16930 [Kitasatospora sp. NPDC101235]